MLSYLSTCVQRVQSADVVPAHLIGRAELYVGVGDRHHGGHIVPAEGIPGNI